MAKLELKYIKPRKDPVRYPKVQVEYENEFVENYSKTLKTIKVNLIQLLD